MTAGLSTREDGYTSSIRERKLEAEKSWLLRIFGLDCVDLPVPGIGIVASFAHIGALPDKLAFVPQSGALVTIVLDWAKSRDIVFSTFTSLGDSHLAA